MVSMNTALKWIQNGFIILIVAIVVYLSLLDDLTAVYLLLLLLIIGAEIIGRWIMNNLEEENQDLQLKLKGWKIAH